MYRTIISGDSYGSEKYWIEYGDTTHTLRLCYSGKYCLKNHPFEVQYTAENEKDELKEIFESMMEYSNMDIPCKPKVPRVPKVETERSKTRYANNMEQYLDNLREYNERKDTYEKLKKQFNKELKSIGFQTI